MNGSFFSRVWRNIAAEVADHLFFLNAHLALDHAEEQITPQLCKLRMLVQRIDGAIYGGDGLWHTVRLALQILFQDRQMLGQVDG